MGTMCHKMSRYGSTVLVREELRLDSLCPLDGEGDAHALCK